MVTGCRCFVQFLGLALTLAALGGVGFAVATKWWYRDEFGLRVGLFSVTCEDGMMSALFCVPFKSRYEDHPWSKVLIAAECGALLCGLVALIWGIVTSTCTSPQSFPGTGGFNLLAGLLSIGGCAYFAYVFQNSFGDIIKSAEAHAQGEKQGEGLGISFMIACAGGVVFLIAAVIDFVAACVKVE
ncbi:unnamed protein product [Bursaphelenchus xylophilus]|uniref:(pine wood nematode) hypothetical protein n=1 Tax=Bursaphelenchus xylophilus TaxID=6326 RepID=A0A1I7RVU8_BURXY|nr:unnamed protein product [Bursaphelenchus xylophilus]CAG9082204.1 unnamed protein product [Bursaphelenchus xylophilus]